jgi:hypothetical protein
MCYHLNTGFGDAFTGVTTIAEKRNMTSRVIEHVDLTPTLTIPAGETLHVRILPWHDFGEVKDSKYIGLRNVSIEGMAFDPSQGVEEVQTGNESCTKILRDGQLFILYRGAMYNVQGTRIQ